MAVLAGFDERAAAERKLAELTPKLEKTRAELAAGVPEWESAIRAPQSAPLEFHPVELVAVESSAGAEFKQLSDGSYLVAGKTPEVDKYTITARSDLNEVTGFRIEALAHPSLGGRGPGRTEHGNFVLSEFRAFASPTREFKDDHRVKVAAAEADYSQGGFPPANAFDGKEPTGWAVRMYSRTISERISSWRSVRAGRDSWGERSMAGLRGGVAGMAAGAVLTRCVWLRQSIAWWGWGVNGLQDSHTCFMPSR